MEHHEIVGPTPSSQPKRESVNTMLDVTEATGIPGSGALDSSATVINGGPAMKPPNHDIAENDHLFYEDTELFLRSRHPDWSDQRVDEELRQIRIHSLHDFYEMAIEIYPDLKDRIPLLPARPAQSAKVPVSSM